MENLESICREKGAGKILQFMEWNPLQDSMQTAVDHTRAIVGVCPRGQAQDWVSHWRGVAEMAMEVFGAKRHITRTWKDDNTYSSGCGSME